MMKASQSDDTDEGSRLVGKITPFCPLKFRFFHAMLDRWRIAEGERRRNDLVIQLQTKVFTQSYSIEMRD